MYKFIYILLFNLFDMAVPVTKRIAW